MKGDKAMLVLCSFTVFFTGITLAVVYFRPNDGQTYTIFSSLLTGFAGALLMHLKGDRPTPPGSTTVTQMEQITKTPPEHGNE